MSTPDQARDALLDVLPPLTDRYSTAAAALAADWYDNLRDQDNIDGRFHAITADLGDQGSDVLARWGVGPLFQAEPDWDAAQSMIAGGLQLRIADAARNTVTLSSIRDPQATGWQRVGHGECDWCNMLIGRGAVYSEATADFAAHDHCRCGATVAWKGRTIPVKPYVPKIRKSQADFDRAKQWMREHPAG